MTTISIRLDDDDKKELEKMCADMGMNISTFYMIYTKKALRDRCIPFEVAAPADPFYSSANQKQIKKADKQLRSGQVVEKSMDELERLEHE
ncbi:MAG: type II toxin-antitoxin system RelB/DinJ family antitoxin [Lachnospiraceae bacterium]|nr:type II toxin-antitoxin system RelB/DinJ family antitoxin [Lachnospiraceae bacterium]